MIPIISPSLAFEEVEADLRAVLESGRLTLGPYLKRFEDAVAAAVGVEHAVAVTSATTAMRLVLASLDVGAGDEVLVSDFTFPATGNVVVDAGARPVLVDCGPDGFVLDIDHAASLVTDRTKALLVVDPFGQPAISEPLLALAEAHGLAVIEDAACALGSSADGVRCGGHPGVPGCFSFHPRKVVTTGEGGAVTTDDAGLADRLRRLRSHGGRPGPAVGLEFMDHGFNFRMSEVQAVLGLPQLARLDDIRRDRQRTAARYEAELSGWDEITLIRPAACEDWSYQSFVVLLDRRDSVVADLRSAGVEATLGTYAMHAQPAFAHLGYAAGDLPQSHDRQQRSLTLPLSPGMPEATVDDVLAALAKAIGRS
ncbi:MAG: DegT/DnrJ/EryC1/StrS family aminotransferase [Acidimicrobiales bacterium]